MTDIYEINKPFHLRWSEKWGKYEASADEQAIVFRLNRKFQDLGFPVERLKMPYTSPESWHFQFKREHKNYPFETAGQELTCILLEDADALLVPLFFLKPPAYFWQKQKQILNPFSLLITEAGLSSLYFSLSLVNKQNTAIFQLAGRSEKSTSLPEIADFLKKL